MKENYMKENYMKNIDDMLETASKTDFEVPPKVHYITRKQTAKAAGICAVYRLTGPIRRATL